MRFGHAEDVRLFAVVEGRVGLRRSGPRRTGKRGRAGHVQDLRRRGQREEVARRAPLLRSGGHGLWRVVRFGHAEDVGLFISLISDLAPLEDRRNVLVGNEGHHRRPLMLPGWP